MRLSSFVLLPLLPASIPISISIRFGHHNVVVALLVVLLGARVVLVAVEKVVEKVHIDEKQGDKFNNKIRGRINSIKNKDLI